MAYDLDVAQFFRRSPREWLQRYFDAYAALPDFDWQTVTARSSDSLMAAFLALNDTLRGEMVEDFTNIKLLATPVGKIQIIDEAHYHDVQEEVACRLADFDDVYACAFYVRLEHKECWDGAVYYAAADGKSRRYWRKRINMPRLGRLPTDNDGRALAAALTSVFRMREGRGDHCVVRQLRRGASGDMSEREYYFAYPQDHQLNTIQFEEGQMTKRPYRPAFEIIFVHNDADQTLTIWHHGIKDRVKDLQQAFARAVLKQDIARDSPRDDRVYDLSRFMEPTFAFCPAPELGIEKVEVRRIGIRVLGDQPHFVSIDLGAATASHVLARRIEAITAGIPATLCKATRVGCRVMFQKKATEKRAKTRSFELAWPNSCSLQNDPHDILIQRMLETHGIEPRRPSGGGGDAHPGS